MKRLVLLLAALLLIPTSAQATWSESWSRGSVTSKGQVASLAIPATGMAVSDFSAHMVCQQTNCSIKVVGGGNIQITVMAAAPGVDCSDTANYITTTTTLAANGQVEDFTFGCLMFDVVVVPGGTAGTIYVTGL